MTEYSKLKEFLQSFANNKTIYDNIDLYLSDLRDTVSINIHDIYERGLDDGEVSLAREILAEFFSEEDNE